MKKVRGNDEMKYLILIAPIIIIGCLAFVKAVELDTEEFIKDLKESKENNNDSN